MNDLHIITLYKLHNKLRCESRPSCRAYRAALFDKLNTAKMHGLDTSNVSSRVVSRRDEPSGIWAMTWADYVGLVWSLRPNDIDVQLLTASRELMQQLETETGIHPGWINNGGLFIASTKERLDEYKRLMTVWIYMVTQKRNRIRSTSIVGCDVCVLCFTLFLFTTFIGDHY